MELQLISQRPESMGRILRPYMVDGIDTIGAFGDEPFSLVFNNSSRDKVEAIISVDGRNVLSGREATLEDTRRFVVQGYGQLKLDAWPEDNQGGGRFVFTQECNGVAVHTPGDLSAIGYISVAVFSEGAPPQWEALGGGPYRGGGYEPGLRSFGAMRGAAKSAVGVGERVEQRISTTTGLRTPVYDRTVQLRHIWWDDLVTRLRELGIQPSQQHPTGFFHTNPRPLANLGSTPRPASSVTASPASAGEYSRFR